MQPPLLRPLFHDPVMGTSYLEASFLLHDKMQLRDSSSVRAWRHHVVGVLYMFENLGECCNLQHRNFWVVAVGRTKWSRNVSVRVIPSVIVAPRLRGA